MGFQLDQTVRLRSSLRFAVAALALIVSSGAAFAQTDTAPAHQLAQASGGNSDAPKIAERPQSLKLEFSSRTVSFGVAQAAREIMTTRQIPFAPGSWEVTSDARRAITQLRDIFRGNAPKGAPFAILVSGGDEVVNYRRARALRTQLIEMQLEDAAKVVIAARAAGEGQASDDGKARVDLVPLDPARCGGCGDASFRTLALDTGVQKLVRATAEDTVIPASQVAGKDGKDTTDVATAPVPPVRQQATEKAQQRTQASAPRPAQKLAFDHSAEPRYDGRTVLVEPDDYGQQRRRISRSVNRGCQMPDIVIDDYYPGGPLVGCDGSYGPRPRW
ncbi:MULTISPECIES: hypothetical protein [unclassified Bosea (in: a-proteobacteria)]|uniref:hypothetical protein n=1 Tax=unclassified Bosea (in: a-proteobacteria) TaxID=2653178 RepID=UPI000F75781E|nr:MULTISPECIES: hypothetical protein [unclassified Bosea (in: a-proteobacteria)]AZO79407.1 hypothetical protein BLM15_18715 [Bosea sp. Tri-49]RXT16357.1 hypothetical protein B5U98_30690 [Bosea sp. Tri-39]RXT40051.1 hypothetical protein B5U99_07735 [Bosea sp. Tri-54]